MRVYPDLTPDGEFQRLGGLGYTGALNDRQYAFFKANLYPDIALPDMFRKAIVSPAANRNLLTFTEQFDNIAWDKGIGGSITSNTVVAPDGTLTADSYVSASAISSFARLSQTTLGLSQNPNTFSIWLKRPSGAGNRTVRLAVSDVLVGTAESPTATVTEEWQRLSFTRTSLSTTGTLGAGLSPGLTGTPLATGDVLHVWGAQLEAGSTATAYQVRVS